MNLELVGHLALATIIGAGVVGSSVSRTISVDRGNIKGAVIHSLINSVTYFYSVWAISKEDYAAYTMTAVGSTVLMAYMAYKNRRP